MEGPTSISSFSELNNSLQFPEQEHLKCPRCESNNTKFCYYNNYNLSQPRHYCKNCRRYWTKGGSLRNIPIGGGTRKITKRSSSSSARTQLPKSSLIPGLGQNSGPETKPGVGQGSGLLEMVSEGQSGNFVLEGLGLNGLKPGKFDGPCQDSGLELSEGDGDGNGNNGWHDLAICTQPGLKFQ